MPAVSSRYEPLFGLGRGVHLDVEVLAAHEDAEQREVDVIAQRHGDAVADDLDVDRVERAACGSSSSDASAIARARTGSRRSGPGAQRLDVDAVRGRGRGGVGHRRQLAPVGDRAPEVETQPAEEHQRDRTARAPTA